MAQDNPYAKYRQSAPANGSAPVIIDNPYRAAEEQRAAADELRRQQDQEFEQRRLAMEAERIRLAQEAANLSAQTGALSIQKTQQDIQKEYTDQNRNLVKEEQKRIQKSLQTDNVLEALNMARSQIGEGWATGNFFGGGFWQGVPGLGQGSANLAATLSGIQGSVINDTIAQLKELSSTGASGYGSLTETEAQRLAAAVGALQQTQDANALRTNLARVERHYRNALALINGEDPRDPAVAEKYGIVSTTDDDGPAGAAGGSSGGSGGGELRADGQFVNDPALRGVNRKVEEMIRSGRSADEIASYLDAVRPGLSANVGDLSGAVAAYRQDPSRPLQIDVENAWKPNSGLMQTLGEFGMSPVGSALIGAADVASLGFLDNITANPEMTRAVMGGLSEENPTSYLLGQIVGGAGSGIGIEAALARGGLTGLRGARVGDALFGAGYGAGMADDPDDSRITGALLGAGGGLAGGAVGRTAARAGGRIAAGVGDASQRALNAAGIRMTPGQILGGGIKRTEDRLAGLPLVGDAIQRRRQEGLQDFNRAAFNEALSPIGRQAPEQLGGAGIDAARAMRSEAYNDALSGVRLEADEPFTNDIAALLARSSQLPESMADISRRSLELRLGEPLRELGQLDGRAYQQVLRGLRRDAASVESQPFGWDVAQINRGAEEALEGMAQRQSPGVVEGLRNANAANMNVETLRAAVNAARNQGGEVFTPAQLSSQAAITARKFGNNQGTTNQPFYGLTRAGQEVLPSQIPDSGTAGRMALPAMAFAAGGGGGYAASEGDTGTSASSAVIAALVASAPYSAAARDTLQRLLMSERPQAVRQAGEFAINNSDIAGLLASPVVVGYVGQ